MQKPQLNDLVKGYIHEVGARGLEMDWAKWDTIAQEELDFQQSAYWLWAAYLALQDEEQNPPNRLPQFVACYSPAELTMLLVSEEHLTNSSTMDYFLYHFEWGERGATFVTRDHLYTETF